MQLDEGILSWCFFRILEALSKQDVPDAQSYALDGVKYLMEGQKPERYS